MKSRTRSDVAPEVERVVALMMEATKTTDEGRREAIRREIEEAGRKP